MQTSRPEDEKLLRLYEERSYLEYVMWMVTMGCWPSTNHELSFRPVAQMGPIEVGLCTWSSSAQEARDFSEIVAYARSVNNKSSVLLATEESSTDEKRLFREIRIPLPKKRWWHKRQYQKERHRIRPEVEKALLNVQEWAERRIGITEAQQLLITAATENIKLRNQAMAELNLPPEAAWDEKLLASEAKCR